MKRSTDRILTTHCGSVPAPNDMGPVTTANLREATVATIRNQVNAGVDVVSDGELSRRGLGFGYAYYGPRIDGISTRPLKEGETAARRQYTNEILEFQDFYREGLDNIGATPPERMVCSAALSYKGQELIKAEIANFQSALKDANVPVEDAFMCVLSPGWLEHFLFNEYYRSDQEFLFSLAEVLHEEYKAIVDAGFLVQLDDPALATKYDMIVPSPTIEEYRKIARLRVEALNHALEGIPEDRVRYHLCWGGWHGPHTHDLPLKEIVDLMLDINAGAYSIEASNPRHAHEWKVWRDVKLPDGKVLMPGVVNRKGNVVEHPELVSDRIQKFAELVGRENVIAGTDCGMATQYQIAWAKLRSLHEGAELATKDLWGR